MKTQTTIDPINPPAVHEWTGPTGVRFRDIRSAGGNYYHDTTPPAVVAILDRCMKSEERIRIFLGDTETGADWCEECDTIGTVGRSTGWKKTALLIRTSRSMGGGAILADCIVRIMAGVREIYRHPLYAVPSFTIRRNTDKDKNHEGKTLASIGYEWAVDRTDRETEGQAGTIANFKNEKAAIRFVQFMRGERHSK